MKTNRRQFLTSSFAAAGAVAVGSFMNTAFGKNYSSPMGDAFLTPPTDIESDEDFWFWVQQSFTASPNIMNLNNGGVCPQPRVVQDAFEHYNRVSNEGPAYYMWQVVGEGREAVRKDLARLGGCSPEEVAIQRNTTEALETVIFGMNLKKGDEVVLTKQDYPNMINAWKQREKRDGVVLKWIYLPQPVEDDDLIVKTYVDAFTSKTKVIEIMHMINWSGQILPVKKIAKAARDHGIDVLVDGAHTFAHLPFQIPDLDCEYFGTSLHKWLYAPFGTGMLWIKKEKIKEIWPFTAPGDPESDNIRKFEAMGTRSFPAELAIGKAIDFHYMIGQERKKERLNYLRNYWMERIRDIPKVKFFTSFDPKYACGLGNFGIEGMTPGELQKALFDRYKIFTVAINWENIVGVRVTPNIYTTTSDLDQFVQAVREIAG